MGELLTEVKNNRIKCCIVLGGAGIIIGLLVFLVVYFNGNKNPFEGAWISADGGTDAVYFVDDSTFMEGYISDDGKFVVNNEKNYTLDGDCAIESKKRHYELKDDVLYSMETTEITGMYKKMDKTPEITKQSDDE